MQHITHNIITTIVLVSAIITGTLYFIVQEKSGSVVDVKVEVYLDNQGYAHITNLSATLRHVSKISIPRGNDLKTPGVVVNVIHNKHVIGYWTSTGLNLNAPLNSTITYNLTVGLTENPEGDIDVIAKLVGFRGETWDSKMFILNVS